jgi:hypothetical protein
MIFTATIYLCLIGEPHSYETCELTPSNTKYRTEESCMAAVVKQVEIFYKIPQSSKYEIIDLKCHQYGSKSNSI